MRIDNLSPAASVRGVGSGPGCVLPAFLKGTARCIGILLGIVAIGPGALAFRHADHDALPNYDGRVIPGLTSTFAQQQALVQFSERTSGLQFSRDRLLGTVRHVSASGNFLPVSQVAIPTSAALVAPAQDPHGPIKRFLDENAVVFGHGSDVLVNATIKRDYVTRHNGLRTVIWEQTVDEIPIFDGLLSGHVTRDGRLVSISSRFLPDAAQAASLGTPGYGAFVDSTPISAQQSIVRAAANLGAITTAESLSLLTGPEGREKSQRFIGSQLRGEAYVKLVWLPTDRNQLRLCWRVVISVRNRPELYSVVVDAQTGETLVRRCLTNYLTDVTYNVYTSDSPSPFSPGWPNPNTGQPPEVPRELVTLSALSTNASPNGWINDNDNQTRGNNVDAHTDRDDNNQPDLPRPQSTNRVFDFPLDLTMAPATYGNASVVQLFYLNNWMHDQLYELGFTEAAGNFQNTNFNRGGLGGDAVAADGQDGGGFDNANFATPPDGIPGRMQMYIFSGPNPDRDGSLDAEVVLHEYTHGLSNRLVGGGVGIFELQPAGMGEGWSDFYGLSLLSEPADDVHGVYPAGGYLTYRIAGFNFTENYYFGIRRYPYSTDMARNPLTLKDIDPTQADPHISVPVNPIFGGGPADEVHNMGEVWCVTLWEARANLVESLGFVDGNRMILQLVTDGMKLSPENPTFLEARDAIIRADEVLTGGDNRADLWIAFAKRGMGVNARVPGAFTTVGVIEDFTLPDDVVVSEPDGILEVSITPANRAVMFAGETITMFVRVTDGTAVTNATINATLSTGGTLSFVNDGTPPDLTANNSVYSATLVVPTNATSLTVTLEISALDKITSTNVAAYIIVPLPTNDAFANAIKVPLAGAEYVSNNKLATLEPSEPLHAGLASADASLWWTWSSPQTTNVLVDTGGSLFNTVVAVYTGNQLTFLTPVASADDVGGRVQAFVKFTANAGVAYKIAVASRESGTGGSLYLRILPGGQPDTNAPVLTISSPRSGFVSATNRLAIMGSAFDPQPNPSGIERISISVRANAIESEQIIRWRDRAGVPGVVESTNWFAIIALTEGDNLVRVSVTDVAGNVSVPVTLQLRYNPLDPPNDIFANALPLPGGSGVVTVNSLRATKEFGEPNHAGNTGGRSVWWLFRAPADGTLLLNTTNSTFDTLLAVYRGTRVNALTEVAANDDVLDGVTFSKVVVAVRANEDYRVVVDGFDGAGGVVFLTHDFVSSSIFRVTINSTPGGRVDVSSAEFPGGTPLLLRASPDFGYEFAGWTGSVTSQENPLSVVVNGDLTLTAQFRVRSFADGFETGDFSALPWTFGGNAPWIVQTNEVSFGRFAARSGDVADGQRSSLILTRTTPAGVGSFDLRVSSEAVWDRLQFYLNGSLKQEWSGDTTWRSFQFAILAGTNVFEWRYAKDFSRSAGLDAAFIDNFDLPVLPTAMQLLRYAEGGMQIRLQGQSGYSYVIQASSDLLNWQPVSTNTAVNGVIQIVDPDAPNHSARFYRAVSALAP